MSANRFFAPAPTSASANLNLGTVDLTAVEEAGNSANVLNYEIQQLEQMAHGIDNLHAIAEQSLEEEGGLSAQAYTVVQSQAAAVMAVTEVNPLTVNVQSFDGGPSDRSTATNVCMLALKDTAMNIWNAIIKAIKEALQKLKVWFAKMTNAVPGMIKKFEKVRDEAQKKTSGLKDDSDITLSSSQMNVIGAGKNRVATREQIAEIPGFTLSIAKGMTKLSKAVKEVNKEVADKLSSFDAETPADIVKSIKETSDFMGQYITDLSKDLQPITNAKDLGVGEGSMAVSIGIGNMGFLADVSIKESEFMSIVGEVNSFAGKSQWSPEEQKKMAEFTRAIGRVAKMRLSFRSLLESDADDADEFEFKAFSSNEISDICDDAIEGLKGIETYKQDEVGIEKVRQTAIARAEKVAAKVGKTKKDADTKLQARATDLAKASLDTIKGSASLTPTTVAYTLKALNVALAACNDSVKAHK